MKSKSLILSALCFGLWGCAVDAPFSEQVEVAVEGETGPRPEPRPASLNTTVTAVAPPSNAQTEEQFDTTTAEEREAAAAAPATPTETRLGSTIASLGNPADPGFWMETPLVSTVVQGRVEFPATGKSAQVELRPIDGPSGAGSRLSLPAFRVIEAPLTGLPELIVYTSG